MNYICFNIEFQKKKKKKVTSWWRGADISAIFYCFICTQIDRWAVIILSLYLTTTTKNSHRLSIGSIIQMNTHLCISSTIKSNAILHYTIKLIDLILHNYHKLMEKQKRMQRTIPGQLLPFE